MGTELGNMCFNSPKLACKGFMGEPYGAGNKPQEKKKTAWNQSNTGEEITITHPNTRSVHASH
jgi:hypothetical protein